MTREKELMAAWLGEGGGIVSVIDELPQRLMIKDRQSVYIACNEAYARDLGRPVAEIVGRTDADFFAPELAATYVQADQRVMRTGEALTLEEPFVIGDRHSWLRTSKKPLHDDKGEVVGVLVIFEDVTEQHELTESLRRHDWALTALHRAGEALIRAGSEEELIADVCAALTHDDEYPLCWIGWARDDEARTVEVTSTAGRATAYADGLHISWGDGPLGQGPTGRAIRENKVMVNNRAASQSSFNPWKERALKHGIAASIAVPLQAGDHAIGALTVYARNEDSFGEREIGLFQEFAGTLMFGIEARRNAAALEAARQSRVRQDEKLRGALEDALAAIAGVLEQRDPYTAGHQKHVADLAIAIGRELGLDAERLHALLLAATVHDLGKIEVPVEILTKPARLNPAEFALVKRHPEVGYQLLKRIEFPWPIADIIRQHHETIDGNGYPQGLKGDQILIEAKILSVADIVESISSDRPYRPALGLDQAITEIVKMRGTKLDPVVVDACLRVLSRGEFTPNTL
ncbi:HD domain-containing phosphohydrolase [Zavarzinia aquatilis]|uniref:Uncharacterized protein n=1 Tax=Zavarzinia aquatilis TaxID=2211142 RepID=A0A317DYU1_9PROT|nr:HD domain-containing phosphohydrolase [Zavarzinia aquatilis]PWR18183.1 hypothetical protein DKG74_19715 [Zavarzinia aquatilis]